MGGDRGHHPGYDADHGRLTPVKNLYVSGGWGTGGYKAIPAGGETMAHTVAHDAPHPLIADFGLDRFESGALIDEGAASGVAH